MADILLHFCLLPSAFTKMAFDLGELAISMNLHTAGFDRDFDLREKRLERFGLKRLMVLMELDDSGTKAIEKFQNNIVKTQRWLNSNPLTPRADRTELKGLNEHIEGKRSLSTKKESISSPSFGLT